MGRKRNGSATLVIFGMPKFLLGRAAELDAQVVESTDSLQLIKLGCI
jgi:hypothetical protein